MASSFKYGVSAYSYVEDFGSVMTLEDLFDHIDARAVPAAG